MFINNAALAKMVKAGEVKRENVFRHRYDDGQVDYGYMQDGEAWAWFGGDYPEEVDIQQIEFMGG